MSNSNYNQPITSLSSLQSLISQMKSSSSFTSRQNHIRSLLSITDSSLFSELIASKGIHILSKWIHDYKDACQGGGDLSKEEENLVIDIIRICDQCYLSISDLKDTKIGKNINKLGKELGPESRAKRECEEIVEKWRRMIDKANDDSNDNYVGRKTHREYNDDEYSRAINTNNKHTTNTNDDSSRNNLINSNTNNKTKTLKSCLKSNGSKNSKIKVKFENDKNLTKVKIFKMNDQPNAPNITNEEYLRIQKEVALNPHIFKNEDIRMKEIKMDKPRVPQIKWRHPLKLSIESASQTGKNSKEKNKIEDICKKVLSRTYFTNIPEPKERESKLFAFEDENIPKIENSKIATHTSTITIDDVFAYIDSLHDKAITQEIINEISSKLESIEDLSQDKKNAIISQLKTRLTKQNPPQPQPTPIPLPNQPILPQPNMMNPNAIPSTIPMGMNPMMNARPNIPFGFFPNMIRPFPLMEQPKMFIDTTSRMNLAKYKTKPCRNYHSSVGCTRGDGCHFIHDPAYAGVEIPNFNLANYEKVTYPGINPNNNTFHSTSMNNTTTPQPQTEGPTKEGEENGEIANGQITNTTTVNNPNPIPQPMTNPMNRNMMMLPMMIPQNMMMRPPMMMYNYRNPMMGMMPMMNMNMTNTMNMNTANNMNTAGENKEAK